MNLGGKAACLRKMFVKPEYRGKEHGVSRGLFDTLVRRAMETGYERIYLETISVFEAAMKFYAGNGFRRIDRSQLPRSSPVIKVAEFFFVYHLHEQTGVPRGR